VEGIQVLCLRGEPYEMGLQQGHLLADTVGQLVTDYLHQYVVHDLGVPQSVLATYARVIDASVPPQLRQEMRGIADGAGLPYQDVLLLNTVPDFLALTRHLPVLELSPAVLVTAARASGLQQAIAYRTQRGSGLSCASYAVWGDLTLDGSLLAAHRLEAAWEELLNRNLWVTVRQPALGNAFVSLGLAGTVGVWAGMNEEQIIVALSSSPSVDVAASGQPLTFALRQVLERAGDMDQGLQSLLSAARLCGGNVLMGDAKVPQAAAVELSAHRHATFEVAGSAEVVARTNHFVDGGLAVGQAELMSEGERLASVARLSSLYELLELNAGWIGASKALTILKDDPRAPSTVAATAGTTDASRAAAHMVLFDPRRGGMWIVQGGSEAWLAWAELLAPGGCCAVP
jgi:hypothetical protein